MTKKLLIAGGGTGGHVFCGLALAEEWTARGGDVLFVGTQRGMEFKLVPMYRFNLETIKVFGLKNLGLVKKIKALFQLPLSFFQSLKILKKYRPDVAIGIGGYASGPAILAAWLLKIPTAVIDQNSMPGLTNKILGRIVKRVFLTFDDSVVFFKKNKVRLFGNPVIKKRRVGLIRNNKEKILLVCGGSQGARTLNDLICAAAPLIIKQIPDLKIIHQTGVADFEKIKKYYIEAAVQAQVAPFFDSMNEVYSKASLLVSRSGAGTLTEIALWGIPAIFIPFPYAADDHQRLNALHFVRKGAALMLTEDRIKPELLAQKICELFGTDGVLHDMGERAKQLGAPEAAKNVVTELWELAG